MNVPITPGMVIAGLAIFATLLAVSIRFQGFRLAVDVFSTWVGKAAGWLIVVLTLAVSYEVFSRYLLNSPTTWAFDVSYMLYGALFLLAGPYALARNGHVRGDFLYRQWAPRRQAWWDLVLYFLFFFPSIVALMYAGYGFAAFSWMIKEHSSNSPNGPPLYHFKTLIPLVGSMMMLQGIVEVSRCIDCIRTGEWPQRLSDVEETEKVILDQAQAGKGV
jgi:TRAP-type mannitol/chloroaromatic compound transport system permease small subunit